MDRHYDVAIVGAGIAGLMAAYTIKRLAPVKSVVVLDKGKDISTRICPLASHRVEQCLKCNPCAIMSGAGGAGCFSDGKVIVSNEYGGWLNQYISDEKSLDLQKKFVEILYELSRDLDIPPIYHPDDELKKVCIQRGLTMLQADIIHLGTENNKILMSRLIELLRNMGVNFYFSTEVAAIGKDEHEVRFFDNSSPATSQSGRLSYGKLILAPGRFGSEWFADWCSANGIKLVNNQLDIGVRFECPRVIWEDISKKVYEPKLLYRTSRYADTVRSFCFNDGGEVVIENTNGVFTVNGHANASESLKTDKSNFAILTSLKFTEPFNEPLRYMKHICELSNMITNGGVVVQRFGDLKRGQRSTIARISQSTFKPSLKGSVPGDLSLVLPKRILDDTIEFIEKLDEIAPGTKNPDNLLYGIEAKFIAPHPEFGDGFKISDDIACVGDGAGITRSISQAAASGMYAAEKMVEDILHC